MFNYSTLKKIAEVYIEITRYTIYVSLINVKETVNLSADWIQRPFCFN